jgi:hypothetical protein
VETAGATRHAAEIAFGAEFMANKRAVARREAAEARTRAAVEEKARERDVVPWLRQLGFRVDESRRAAALCDSIPDASLEQRIKVALSYFHDPRRTVHPQQARP